MSLPIRRIQRLMAIAASLTVSVGATAVSGGCSSAGAAGGGSANTLILYNAQHEQVTVALTKAFTAQTGIQVQVKSGSEDVLTAQLRQEGNRSPADIFYAENSNWLQQLDDQGLLADVNSATMARVPRRDSAANGKWLAVSGRFSAIVYNPSKINAAQLPTSVMQLADSEYKGKLELAPAETDFWPIVAAVARVHGRAGALAWLEGLKANAGSAANAPDNESLVSDVSTGMAGIGLINHYYYYRLRAEAGAGSLHAKLSLLAPADAGYVEDISAAAILNSSHHKAAAQRFLAFLTSGAGQRVLANSDSFEYPLARGVAPNPVLPPRSMFHPNAITPSQLGTGLDARDLLQQAGLI